MWGKSVPRRYTREKQQGRQPMETLKDGTSKKYTAWKEQSQLF